MPAQISVVIAYYRDQMESSAALHSLDRRPITGHALEAAILRREEREDRLEIAEVADFGRHELSGPSIATLFPPSILALGSVGESTTAATTHFRDQGMDINLLKEVGENLPPRGAALVLMIEEQWLAELSDILRESDLERFVMRPADEPEAG